MLSIFYCISCMIVGVVIINKMKKEYLNNLGTLAFLNQKMIKNNKRIQSFIEKLRINNQWSSMIFINNKSWWTFSSHLSRICKCNCWGCIDRSPSLDNGAIPLKHTFCFPFHMYPLQLWLIFKFFDASRVFVKHLYILQVFVAHQHNLNSNS